MTTWQPFCRNWKWNIAFSTSLSSPSSSFWPVSVFWATCACCTCTVHDSGRQRAASSSWRWRCWICWVLFSVFPSTSLIWVIPTPTLLLWPAGFSGKVPLLILLHCPISRTHTLGLSSQDYHILPQKDELCKFCKLWQNCHHSSFLFQGNPRKQQQYDSFLLHFRRLRIEVKLRIECNLQSTILADIKPVMPLWTQLDPMIQPKTCHQRQQWFNQSPVTRPHLPRGSVGPYSAQFSSPYTRSLYLISLNVTLFYITWLLMRHSCIIQLLVPALVLFSATSKPMLVM